VSSRVRDGASLRHARLLAMLGFIDLHGQDPVEVVEIQAYMLRTFGLKFLTTVDYLRECQLAGMVKVTEKGWIVTQRYRTTLMT